ncbi:MAG TPA: lipid-A-disaccharide synthase [Bryobacteraceae bacterium]|nr:lipid-A-disaccharide synthase [Bryobacteraceae bacterium]
MRILISAGEASGDLYASRVVEALKRRNPGAGLSGADSSGVEFFGCAGPRMQASGVRAIVDQRSLAVVGIVEVLAHIPRIYREFRKLVRAAGRERPDVAVLTDSPDFHLRLAKKLHARGIPVIYLIAPQAWAWRSGRTKTMSRVLTRLLCIFPFEEAFFRERGVPATFIGHPLARMVKPSMSRAEFCAKFEINQNERIVVLLPGSRHGEATRHMPYLVHAARLISATLRSKNRQVRYVLALPPGFGAKTANFWEPARAASIQVIEGFTWDCLAQAEVALAASGTVTIEAALAGTPMVTFYRVNAITWLLGRWMVQAPFLSMVNLVAGRRVAAELIQNDMTAEAIASEALRLLEDGKARDAMRVDLAEVAAKLASPADPMETAAEWIEKAVVESKDGARKDGAGNDGERK